jgi:uncharacterized membrane protein YebE (DUF533 family)
MDAQALLEQLLKSSQELITKGQETAQEWTNKGLEMAQKVADQGQEASKEWTAKSMDIAQNLTKQGQEMTKEWTEKGMDLAQSMAEKGKELAEQHLNIPKEGAERDAMLSGLGKGAAAVGTLAVLLGTNAGRRITGAGLKLGSLAALGGLAYKAFQNWQSGTLTNLGDSINELTGPAAEQRSMALIQAMIAAAKADGHIDDSERANITKQIQAMGMDADAQKFISDELDKPLDAKAIAALAESPKAAAEIYLTSLMVINVDNDQERAYLAELASAMNLAPDLVAQLQAEAQKAA